MIGPHDDRGGQGREPSVLTPEQYEQLYREKIKIGRLQLNLTQQELATKIGVSTAAVSGWESGQRFPSARMRRKIDRLFQQLDEAGALL